MLKGQEFGKAIGTAINLKLQNGSAKTKAEIARHFKMKPPSLSDWVKKGAVSKDKLPELWRYFSDVVGPDHWGMSKSEWPHGLSSGTSLSLVHKSGEPDADSTSLFRDATITRLLSIVEQLEPARKESVLIFAEERLALQNAGHQNSTQRAGQ